MLNIGPEKLVLLFAVALIVLGPQELPKVAREFGRIMGSLRNLQARFEAEARSFAESITPAEALDDQAIRVVEVPPPTLTAPADADAAGGHHVDSTGIPFA